MFVSIYKPSFLVMLVTDFIPPLKKIDFFFFCSKSRPS